MFSFACWKEEEVFFPSTPWKVSWLGSMQRNIHSSQVLSFSFWQIVKKRWRDGERERERERDRDVFMDRRADRDETGAGSNYCNTL